MSLSPSSGAHSDTSKHHKPQLLNPFSLSDSNILEIVYVIHLHRSKECDTEVLRNILSYLVLKKGTAVDKASLTGLQQEFSTMKLISLQMRTTPRGDERCVHHTTMLILKHLETYSWDAKALLTVAGFALKYRNLLHLCDVATSDQLAHSLEQLNQVQTREDRAIELMEESVMEVLDGIQQWARWSANGYDTVKVPSLVDALQEIPVVVYWIIASLVAATGNLVGVSNYRLPEFMHRLSEADRILKEELSLIKKQIGYVDDYEMHKKAFLNSKDVVDLIKLLIGPNASEVQIYDGFTKSRTAIEVLKHKYVLLFISSLHRIEDEISLLNSIYDGLKVNEKEIKGFRKNDFKILWLPIVNSWDDRERAKFNYLKDAIKWYAVEYFSDYLPGAELIKEKFNYYGKPIISVLTPRGDILNEDALELIFEWQMDAFPFRKIDGIDLALQLNWLWDPVRRLFNYATGAIGNRCIFIYGGADKKWIQDFTMAVEKTRRHPDILSTDTLIHGYNLGKENPWVVPRFWLEIESKRVTVAKTRVELEIQMNIDNLLFLKRDPQGWAIFSVGLKVKVMGHGELMYRTLAEFEMWRENMFEIGFAAAFEEHYDKIKQTSAPPEHHPSPFNLTDSQILERVYATHFSDDNKCDVDYLLNIASNVALKTRFVEGKASPTSFQPEFRTMKLISCQMMTTDDGGHSVHLTTMSILEHLKSYSWDAKALVTLASFALECGNLLNLTDFSTSEQLANSLKQVLMKQVKSREKYVTKLVMLVVEVLGGLREWGKWYACGYPTEEVPFLSDALQEVPVVVYWIIASLVAATGNLVGVSGHKLWEFESRLSGIDLKPRLDHCRLEMARIEDRRNRAIRYAEIKDVVELLSILIRPSSSQASMPTISQGGTQIPMGIEVFRQKCVMLFISGLDNIQDEILHLNDIYKRLKEKPAEEKEGFKKGDFRILWIPTHGDMEQRRFLFDYWKKDIEWYVLEYIDELPGYDIIAEKLKYDGKPLVSVINSQGQIMNQNALQIIFEWGEEAFPFRQSDAYDLSKKWKWFWSLIEKMDPNTKSLGKDSTSYVFIYRGNDKWIRNLSIAMGNIEKNEIMKQVNIKIENYELEKDKPDEVAYFWMGMNRKKKKEGKNRVDREVEVVVDTLLSIEQDQLGWVLLSRGRKLKLVGPVRPMYQTLVDFDKWKHKVMEKSFDVAFKEYYDMLERHKR